MDQTSQNDKGKCSYDVLFEIAEKASLDKDVRKAWDDIKGYLHFTETSLNKNSEIQNERHIRNIDDSHAFNKLFGVFSNKSL